jgi:hypothetical protein
MYTYNQRENRLRDSVGKFITLHKARALYLGGGNSCLDGLRVVFQVLMSKDSG